MFSESFENHFDYEEDEKKQDEWTEWKWKPFGEKENQQENERIRNDKDELWEMKKQADEHPQNESKEWPITDWKSAIKTIWESLKGEGYESKNSFSTKWKNGENINVEYKKDWSLHTSIEINNENLEITLSWYESAALNLTDEKYTGVKDSMNGTYITFNRAASTLVGSAVTNGTAAIICVGGLAVGAVLGALITKLAAYRKNRNTD